MDAEISLSDPEPNAFAAQARALSQTPTFEQWVNYWDDADSDFGNLNNIRHWIELARDTQHASRYPGGIPLCGSRFKALMTVALHSIT